LFDKARALKSRHRYIVLCLLFRECLVRQMANSGRELSRDAQLRMSCLTRDLTWGPSAAEQETRRHVCGPEFRNLGHNNTKLDTVGHEALPISGRHPADGDPHRTVLIHDAELSRIGLSNFYCGRRTLPGQAYGQSPEKPKRGNRDDRCKRPSS